MEYFKIKNNQTADLDKIPVISYASFNLTAHNMLQKESFHCISYFAFPYKSKLKCIAAFADDEQGDIYLFSFETGNEKQLIALNKEIPALHCFEREIAELYGVHYEGHPWLKPLRYPFNRHDVNAQMAQYPFFKIEGKEVHEVGVGPVHGGVMESGHFRFMCLGENVLHLEQQLGYQHRGLESLMHTKKKLLERNILAESIAGDTVVGHTLAFAHLMESLLGIEESPYLAILRTLALELERVSVHVGDLAAFCEDVAYQLGSNVFGGLRMLLIDHAQFWCRNRLSKGLIRVGYNPWPYTAALQNRLKEALSDFERQYYQMADLTFELPSTLTRFRSCGEVTLKQMKLIGAVGVAARSAGLRRDIRASHPFSYYKDSRYDPPLLGSGDVWARGKIRDLEVRESIRLIKVLLALLEKFPVAKMERPVTDRPMKPGQLVISMTEGWRGEICHTAVTDERGELAVYKIKDPSMHNALALTLAMRNNEISDFPINNRSFNLSYSGHDL